MGDSNSPYYEFGPGVGRNRPSLQQDILQLLREPKSRKELECELNVAYSTLYYHLKRLMNDKKIIKYHRYSRMRGRPTSVYEKVFE